MNFLIIFKVSAIKEGIFGMKIINTTILCVTLFLLISLMNIVIILDSKMLLLENRLYMNVIYYVYFISLIIKSLGLLMFYVNIFTKKFKQILSFSHFIIAVCVWINIFSVIATSINPLILNRDEETESDNSQKTTVGRDYTFIFLQSLHIFFALKMIAMIDLLFYYPLYSYYSYIKTMQYKILQNNSSDLLKEIRRDHQIMIQSNMSLDRFVN